ncbi:hypothetical protein [Streptomyces sp. TLI_171]|nr:hypothetical protein [Streptomyces sp. TLI_171]
MTPEPPSAVRYRQYPAPSCNGDHPESEANRNALTRDPSARSR